MDHYMIHVCFEFISDSRLISHSKGRPIRKVKSSVRVNANLTLSEPNLIPMGEKDLVLCPDIFLFCPSCCCFYVIFENLGFSVKLCKLGEFPLGVEVCYCFRSVRGGSEHMSVVITFFKFS